MIMSLITEILGGPIKTWLAQRGAKRQAEAEMALEIAKANAKVKITKAEAEAQIELKRATADIDWDLLMAQQSSTSWKDEWFTIILSIPLIACFIPGLSAHIMNGFQILEFTPTWYKASVMGAIAAAFGLRALTKFFIK